MSCSRLFPRIGFPAGLLALIAPAFGQSLVIESILRHPQANSGMDFGTVVAMTERNGAYYLALRSAHTGPVIPLKAEIRWYQIYDGPNALYAGTWQPLWSTVPAPAPRYPTFPSTLDNLYNAGHGTSLAFGDGGTPYNGVGFALYAGAPNSPNYDDNLLQISSGSIFYFHPGILYGTSGGWIPDTRKIDPRTLNNTRITQGLGGSFARRIAASKQGSMIAAAEFYQVAPGRTGRVFVYGSTALAFNAAPTIPKPDSVIDAPPAPATSPSTFNQDRFGASIAISADGQWIAIGAPGDASDANGNNGSISDTNLRRENGAVYLYHLPDNSNPTLVAKLKADVPDPGDRFGETIALDATGETLVVGAPAEDSNGSGVNPAARGNNGPTTPTLLDRGAVYVFRRSGMTWTQTHFLKPFDLDFNALPSNQRGNHQFGDNLAFDGRFLAVRGGRNASVNTPSVYVFAVDAANAWTTRQRLAPPSNWTVAPGEGLRFGQGLAIASGRLVVSAPGEGTASARGAVITYTGLGPLAPPPPPPPPPQPVLTLTPDAGSSLIWCGQPGQTYSFQRSPDLLAWTTLFSVVADPVTGKVFAHDPNPTRPASYYRFDQQ